jgi:hypothetical protein
MRTMFIKRHVLKIAMLTCLTFLTGLAGMAFAHPAIPLLDEAGAPLDYDAVAAAAGVAPAYSAKATCGACHDYNQIEKHSYHAQIGANEWRGWNPFNPDATVDKFKAGVGAKGKNWVQSPSHLGKW